MNRINASMSITESVLEELDFNKVEKEFFKEMIDVIKKSRAHGQADTGNELIEKIEKVFNNAV